MKLNKIIKKLNKLKNLLFDVVRLIEHEVMAKSNLNSALVKIRLKRK